MTGDEFAKFCEDIINVIDNQECVVTYSDIVQACGFIVSISLPVTKETVSKAAEYVGYRMKKAFITGATVGITYNEFFEKGDQE